jgi:hypothetical protein
MNLKFELSLDEANVILSAISKYPLPFDVSAPLINKIRSQAEAQLPKEEVKEKAVEKKLKKA